MPFSKKIFRKKCVKTNIKTNIKTNRKTKKTHRKHKRHFFGGEGEEDCPICSEPLKNGEIFETKCKHKFHLQCIGQWCNRTTTTCTCPICRAEIIPKPINIPQDIIIKISFIRFSDNYRTGRMIPLRVRLNDIDDETVKYLKDRILFDYPGIEVNFDGREGYIIISARELNDYTNVELIELEEKTRNNTFEITIDVEPEDDEFERYILRLDRQ